MPVWSAARSIGDVLWAPFGWLPPLLALLLFSAVTGLLRLLGFRLLTPQSRLRRVKDQMSAAVYEMRIFSSSPARVIRAQGRALHLILRYLLFSLPCLVFVVPLLVLVLTRAAPFLEYRPLEAGETALVTVTLDRSLPRRQLHIRATKGLVVRPPLVFAPDNHIYLRVRVKRRGRHRLIVQAAHQSAWKEILAAGGLPSLERTRGDTARLLLSREPVLPAGVIRRLSVDYPRQTLSWIGLPWYLHLVLISMAVAFLLRRRLGVIL